MFDVGDTAARARIILDAARDWIVGSDNPAVENNSRLKREMGLALYRHAKLEETITKPLSVGVYGASQAGKSYFVSALAKGQTGTVMASVGGREVNFLTEINPPGGKESTGLVTRFTRHPLPSRPDFPVTIELLGELDLVKIVANSFYNDVEQMAEFDASARGAQIQNVLNQAVSETRSAISAEDVIELSFYCDKHFGTNAYYSWLKQLGYWSRMERLLPVASAEQRLSCLSILWDNSPRYTRLLQYLSKELARFGGARAILCEAAALFDVEGGGWKRSANSIINVQTLDSVGAADQQQIRAVPADTPGMSPLLAGVGTISALASEITIAIAHQPHDFLSHADLLDFPGARSRHPVDRKKFEDSSDLPIEHFLRGKVAYLFERYCNSFGMTALLLCVGPSNQEVVGLNRLIEDWVADAAGDRPEQRQESPVNLFVVLTKFDTEFSDDLGRAIDESRWDARITASLRKPFGEQQSTRTNWLDRWDSRSSFKNTYWWRSPAADQSNLISYGAGRTEAAFRSDRIDYIERLKLAYLNSDLVKNHFRKPAEAWNAALTLNDGGAGYVMENLERVCRPELRARQIRRQILSNVDKILGQIRPFHVSTDAQALQEAKLNSAKTFMGVAASLLQTRRAGAFLASLTIDERDAIALFDEIRSEMMWGGQSKTGKPQKTADTIDSDLAQLLGISQPPVEAPKASSQTEAAVRAFVSQWAFLTGKKYQDGGLADLFEVEPDLVSGICAEVLTALERLGGISFIADALDRHNFQHGGTSSNWKSAAITAILLNDFLMYTSLEKVKERTVSKLDDSTGAIFSPKQTEVQDHAELSLPEQPEQFSRKLLADWAIGYFDMIKQNAFVDIRDERQMQENLELGRILREMKVLQAE